MILPPSHAPDERAALLRELENEHGDFLMRRLLRRRDILEESARDLRQEALVLLLEHEKRRDNKHPNPRGFLIKTIDHLANNHGRLRTSGLARGVDLDTEATSAPSPESDVDLAERWAEAERCLKRLDPDDAALVRCLVLFEMTYTDAADALGIPRSTASSRFDAAMKALPELAWAAARIGGRQGG